MPATEEPEQPPIKAFGGRYEARDRLGSGGMATVWRAWDGVLQREVALKVFDRRVIDDSRDEEERSRSTSEARLLAGMSHPHLVTVLDAGGDGPERLDYLVMELVAGPTLRDRIHDAALPAPDVVRLGAELSSALAYVHERGVVHRDLKPANILFGSYEADAPAKIADFGIARLLAAAPVTSTGVLVGTATYLSPEQATGARVGTASDVYSLGLVLLECLTGTAAFAGDGVATAAARLHHDPDLSAVRDPQTRELLAAMTARAPEARPDAGAVAGRFDALAGRGAASAAAPVVADALGTLGPTELSTEAMTAPTRLGDLGTTQPAPAGRCGCGRGPGRPRLLRGAAAGCGCPTASSPRPDRRRQHAAGGRAARDRGDRPALVAARTLAEALRGRADPERDLRGRHAVRTVLQDPEAGAHRERDGGEPEGWRILLEPAHVDRVAHAPTVVDPDPDLYPDETHDERESAAVVDLVIDDRE